MPIMALVLICLVISGALAIGNNATQPIIVSAAEERAETARRAIIPDADGFVLLDTGGMPKTITEAYKTTNDKGYVFMISSRGYDGNINLICGIDRDGRIIKSVTLSHTETQGLGTKVIDMESQYDGKDRNLEGISAISGATITSNAYMKGVRDAFEAFEMVK
jgi:electron transport complex protein RnfG